MNSTILSSPALEWDYLLKAYREPPGPESRPQHSMTQIVEYETMEEVTTEQAPNAIGPYSQGIKEGDRVYVSGQGPIDPETGEVVSEDIAEQTAQTIENVSAILEAADSSLNDVLKATVYLTDMGDYEVVNQVYAEYVDTPYPARVAIEVSRLPIDIGVEIEVVARS